ncbi:MAG: ATP-binding protein [Alphaproteobacteria bacterium]|nr:ATP-binding protein [Alphaproteobacteria bacterium]
MLGARRRLSDLGGAIPVERLRRREARALARDLSPLRLLQPLLIGELPYLMLMPEQTDIFFRLIDQRYSRTSTIITSKPRFVAVVRPVSQEAAGRRIGRSVAV